MMDHLLYILFIILFFSIFHTPSNFFFFFFFNDPAPTEIYTLPLHAALPISASPAGKCNYGDHAEISRYSVFVCHRRSEEHTSELQSQSNLVCRLLLEKKKKTKYTLNKL